MERMAFDDDPDGPMAAARTRIDQLQAALALRETSPVRRIETHISWVLLTGTLAYKLKKPVRLPFLDFTTLAARRHACAEELRVNRRLAPELYRDLVDVVETPNGARFGGDGTVVDVAVRMERFADGALWSERIAHQELLPQDVTALAGRLARFHERAAAAPARSGFGLAPVQTRITQRLLDAMEASWTAGAKPARPGSVPDELPRLCQSLLEQSAALEAHWRGRRDAGRICEGHGDLHLGNIVQLASGPTAFDAIEFDDELRWIDVQDDIAFLVMDLLAHDAAALAWRFLDAWLAVTGDHAGLPALRYYLVRRALIRAQVALLGGPPRNDGTGTLSASTYEALALRLSKGDPRLAITRGLPGSGKSHLAEALLETVGAIRVRSDVERKRLFGLSALAPSHTAISGGIYDANTTARTYARLLEAVAVALRSGWPVIVDAAFLQHGERRAFANLAGQLGVPFSILDCHAPLPVLRERLQRRQAAGNDPSEADEAVLARLLPADEPLAADEAAAAITIDTTVPDAAAQAAWRWRTADKPA